jgi:hypothetical protein
MMGFLGVTADITGFELEPSILIFSMLLGCVIQMMKDTADEEHGRDMKRKSQISK